jgi:peptidyl-prolyl cis-trans isomerase B (cyclophilin B)
MKYNEYLNETNPIVKIDMGDLGEMTLELFPSIAPITVKNFLDLVESSFYDGLIFHRVIKGFMIQGGDPQGTGMGGSKNNITGEFRQNGIDNPLEHTRGVISMARAYNPNSASSQFFIMHKDASYLDGAYAAFGAVVNGLEVVDKIANVKTNHNDKPLEPVIIKSIRKIR